MLRRQVLLNATATLSEFTGVVVRGVEAGTTKADALDIGERIDTRGLHTTGELRDKAESLIRVAAEDI